MESELYTRMTKHVTHLMLSSPPIKRHSTQPLPDAKATHLFLDALTIRFDVLQMHPLYEQDLGSLGRHDLPHWLYAHMTLPMEQVWAGLLRRGDTWLALIDAFQQLYCTRAGVSTMDLFDQAFLSARVDKCILELMAPQSAWLLPRSAHKQQPSHKVLQEGRIRHPYANLPPGKPKKQPRPTVSALALSPLPTPEQTNSRDRGSLDDDGLGVPAAESPVYVYHTPVRPRLAPGAPLRRYPGGTVDGSEGAAGSTDDLAPPGDDDLLMGQVEAPPMDNAPEREARTVSPSWSVSSVSTTTSQQEERVHRLQQTFSARMDRAWATHRRRGPLTPPMTAAALTTALAVTASALHVNPLRPSVPTDIGSVATPDSSQVAVTMHEAGEDKVTATHEPAVQKDLNETIANDDNCVVQLVTVQEAVQEAAQEEVQEAVVQEASRQSFLCRVRTKKDRRCRGTTFCAGLCRDHYHAWMLTGKVPNYQY